MPLSSFFFLSFFSFFFLLFLLYRRRDTDILCSQCTSSDYCLVTKTSERSRKNIKIPDTIKDTSQLYSILCENQMSCYQTHFMLLLLLLFLFGFFNTSLSLVGNSDTCTQQSSSTHSYQNGHLDLHTAPEFFRRRIFRFSVALRPQKPSDYQDIHLDLHTAPEFFRRRIFRFSVALRPQKPSGLIIRGGKPRTSTSTHTAPELCIFTHPLVLYVHRDHKVF